MTDGKRSLPKSASNADPGLGDRLHAPSAARNVGPILRVIQGIAPSSGLALELASGTGEHVARFAAALPSMTWQPTEIDDRRLASIHAWTVDLPNVRPPLRLDVTKPGWSGGLDPPDLIYLSNLLHLIDEDEARIATTEAARLLAPSGILLIYGPFLRDTGFASAGDESFHEDLVRSDPTIGYKSVEMVQGWQSTSGLDCQPAIEMPANNLILFARKPA